jgi:hypothetical protein
VRASIYEAPPDPGVQARRSRAPHDERRTVCGRKIEPDVAYFLARAAAVTASYTVWPSFLHPPSPLGDLLIVPGDGGVPTVGSSGTGMVFLDSSSLLLSTFDFLHLCSGVPSPWIGFSISRSSCGHDRSGVARNTECDEGPD